MSPAQIKISPFAHAIQKNNPVICQIVKKTAQEEHPELSPHQPGINKRLRMWPHTFNF